MENTQKICDLHTHTVYSDGTLTPCELVAEAIRAGISAVALTDHNNCDGLDIFLAEAGKCGLEAAPGVELSTEYKGIELHLIAMFITPDQYPKIKEFVGDLKERKNLANRALVDKLNAIFGYEMDYDELMKLTPDGYVNRAHIAADMVKRGYVCSFKEAFDGFLREDAGYYVPPRRADFFDALDFVSSLGAVSILAHPLLQLSREELEELLPIAKEHGLCAFETQYAAYSKSKRNYSSKLARRLGLIESGGSDFHGANKPDQKLGVGRGDLIVPYEFFERLRKKVSELK